MQNNGHNYITSVLENLTNLKEWPLIVALITIVLLIIIISSWIIYRKSGKEGWETIIPIYNILVLLQITELPIWYLILFFIPIINLYMFFKIYIELAHKFGKSTSFGIVTVLFSFICLPILAFGKSNTYNESTSKNETELEQSNINNNLDLQNQSNNMANNINVVNNQNTIEQSKKYENNNYQNLQNTNINNPITEQTPIDLEKTFVQHPVFNQNMITPSVNNAETTGYSASINNQVNIVQNDKYSNIPNNIYQSSNVNHTMQQQNVQTFEQNIVAPNTNVYGNQNVSTQNIQPQIANPAINPQSSNPRIQNQNIHNSMNTKINFVSPENNKFNQNM